MISHTIYRSAPGALLAAVFSLASGVATAQITTSTMKMAGNIPGAHADMYQYDNTGPSPVVVESGFTLYPVFDSSGQAGYFAVWGYSKYFNYGSSSAVAVGFAPLSVATALSPDAVTISLDISQLRNIGWESSDCDFYSCTVSNTPPATFPLRGTVAAYGGAGGYVRQYLGAYVSKQVQPLLTFTTSSQGNFTERSANFVGTIGALSVTGGATPWASYSAILLLNRGDTTIEVAKSN